MTARNLSTVATDLIESYGNTAKNVINAYRVGGERVVGLIDQRWENALEKSAGKLKPEVRGNALLAQQKLTAIYTGGIDLATGSADAVVEKVVELAARGVRQLAANANQFAKGVGTSALNTIVALVAVPAAEAASTLASKMEQKSGLLADKLAGKETDVNVTAVKRVTAFKRARARSAA